MNGICFGTSKGAPKTVTVHEGLSEPVLMALCAMQFGDNPKHNPQVIHVLDRKAFDQWLREDVPHFQGRWVSNDVKQWLGEHFGTAPNGVYYRSQLFYFPNWTEYVYAKCMWS